MAKANWAVVNPSQGSGNATVNVSSSAPHTGRNVRTTVLTITAANVEAKTVNVTQQGKPAYVDAIDNAAAEKGGQNVTISGKSNAAKLIFSLGTGAAVGLYDDNQKKEYGLEYGRRYSGTLVGAGGELKDVRVCNTFAEFEGVKIPQFLLADISNVVKAIKKETGIEILGIISLPQMKMCNLSLDCNDNEIIIE